MNTKISVIIPVYNKKDTIEDCVRSLRRQTFPFAKMEILLIDDGSADGSGALTDALSAQYPNVRCFHQENGGVSAARNMGIRHASGQYLFFLDADDTLSHDCIRKVADFFDTLPDEVELVTYPLVTICDGERLGPHFRYQYLRESGVYDLREHPYIGQTTINIAVRNRFEDNILFDETQNFLEDQKYCCALLRGSLQMGFCADGAYIYNRSGSGTAEQISGACYIFEQSMRMFEEMFAWYEKPQPADETGELLRGSEAGGVPAAFQGLYVFDLYWKLCDNILFPYHYEEDDYGRAVGRIRTLLKMCDPRVILQHPQMDIYEKFYLLRLRDPDTLQADVSRQRAALLINGQPVLQEAALELVLTKLRVRDGRLELRGYVKSALFQFYRKPFTLCAVENDGFITRKIPLSDSPFNYYRSLEKTQRFAGFCYTADVNEVKNVRFEAGFQNKWFPTRFTFDAQFPLSELYGRMRTVYQGCEISLQDRDTKDRDIKDENMLCFAPVKRQAGQRIWIYADCSGVAFDNGGLQFLHDARMQDGIRRYYIVTDERQRARIRTELPEAEDGSLVPFGSAEHKRLLADCELLLTAYIEDANIFPYSIEEIEKYADRFTFETIYLQHGVFHIEMPWKFCPERIRADRVVVSTQAEKELFLRNGFREEDLIETGMARFGRYVRGCDAPDAGNPGAESKGLRYPDQTEAIAKASAGRILYAPSWRYYLAGEYVDRRWEIPESKLLHSDYFQGILQFLQDSALHKLLAEHGMQMDVKLHPAFEACAKHLPADSPQIRSVTGTVREEEYSLMITDFSSYAYDFYYLGTPVLYFLPDADAFFSGMNGFRQIADPPDYRQRAARTPEKITAQIARVLAGEDADAHTCAFLPFQDPAGELYHRLAGC